MQNIRSIFGHNEDMCITCVLEKRTRVYLDVWVCVCVIMCVYGLFVSK